MNNLIILCRHHNINIFITAQHLHALPPLIRSNARLSSGGNGGSALITGRYTDLISGLQIGLGGSGANSSSTPVTKINYGDGGDGNSGFGRQGIIILKFTGDVITKFLEYADYNKLFNKPNFLSKEETSNIFGFKMV